MTQPTALALVPGQDKETKNKKPYKIETKAKIFIVYVWLQTEVGEACGVSQPQSMGALWLRPLEEISSQDSDSRPVIKLIEHKSCWWFLSDETVCTTQLKIF